jgi:hypothetical protein
LVAALGRVQPDRSGTHRVLTELAADLWVADAPPRYVRIEIGRRMTVPRLADGALWIHSPIRLDRQLRSELERLGRARFVVRASSRHGHLYMEQYEAEYPEAILTASGRRWPRYEA